MPVYIRIPDIEGESLQQTSGGRGDAVVDDISMVIEAHSETGTTESGDKSGKSNGKVEATWKTEEAEKAGTASEGHDKWIDVLSNSDPEPVGLLLPAVQAAREAARAEKGDATTTWNVAENVEFNREPAPDSFVFVEQDPTDEPMDALLVINHLGQSTETVWDDTDIVHVVVDNAARSGDWDSNGSTDFDDFLG